MTADAIEALARAQHAQDIEELVKMGMLSRSLRWEEIDRDARETYLIDARGAVRALSDAGFAIVPSRATEAMVAAGAQAMAKSETPRCNALAAYYAMAKAGGANPDGPAAKA